MSCIPKSGRISCNKCFKNNVEFGRTELYSSDQRWRINNNPLAFGGTSPEVAVMGFSKGPTQVNALMQGQLHDIAFKGGRLALAKIMRRIGLLEGCTDTVIKNRLDVLIKDSCGPVHFGSMVKCAVEQKVKDQWVGTGAGMLDKFASNPFGDEVTQNCVSQHLVGQPPESLKVVVLLGLGTRLNYVQACREVISKIKVQNLTMINEVAYTDGSVTYVHTEHFASRGAHPLNWLGERDHHRQRYGELAA